VTAVGARGGKFAQTMTNHILGDIDGDMAATIMDGDRMPNHLREDYACPAPSANDFLIALFVHGINFYE